MKTAARIFNALGLFMIILVLLLYLLIMLPELTQLQTHEITSGSMEPAILTGSLTFTREISFDELKPADIIVFRPGDSEDTVTHRITAIDRTNRKITTKGDANEIEDLNPIDADRVEGKVLFSIPLLGLIEGFFTTLEGKFAAGSILFGAILLKLLGGRLEKITDRKEKTGQRENESEESKKRNGNTPLLDALLLLFVFCAIFALYKLISPVVSHKISAVEYNSLEDYISEPKGSVVSVQKEASAEAEGQQDKEGTGDNGETETNEEEYYFPWEVEWPEADFEALKEINPDVVAWLYIDGTQVNYPIVKGEDNDYYLYRSFKGTRNSAGCLFLDYRNSDSFTDLHANIYGHHMNNGSMMAGIVKYKNQDFFDEHPYGMLVTPDANYLIEFYSGFIANGYDDAWQVKFTSYSDYEAWLDKTVSRSLFTGNSVPCRNDQILTLSTCTYEFYDARFVLNGILHKEPPKT